MGGHDSQKLLPWRGICSSPGRKPPAHYEINTVTEKCAGDLAGRRLPRPAGSATDCLGHFWEARVVHFWRAPKSLQWCDFLHITSRLKLANHGQLQSGANHRE